MKSTKFIQREDKMTAIIVPQKLYKFFIQLLELMNSCETEQIKIISEKQMDEDDNKVIIESADLLYVYGSKLLSDYLLELIGDREKPIIICSSLVEEPLPLRAYKIIDKEGNVQKFLIGILDEKIA